MTGMTSCGIELGLSERYEANILSIVLYTVDSGAVVASAWCVAIIIYALKF